MPAGITTYVANSPMTVTPQVDWNRWSARPSPKSEIWTIDGASLNELSFFAQISNGEPIYRERDKRNFPLPKFNTAMLPTDLVDLFEASNRILLQTSLFQIDKIEPAMLGGYDAVRFSYHYVLQNDELDRNGEGVAAIIDGKLYLVNFVAPAIHYYDRDLSEFRTIVDSVKI